MVEIHLHLGWRGFSRRVSPEHAQGTLSQKGFPFGTGRREAWFAAGKGLIKLVFSHRDGSVSTVERLR